MSQATKKWEKDPDASLYYVFDFAQKTNKTGYGENYLIPGEQLSSFEIETDSDLVIDESSLTADNTQVLLLVSGGYTGNTYNITCRVNTTFGQSDDFTKQIVIREK